MNKHKFSQRGASLLEILAASLLLVIGVLGSMILQYRAITVTVEAIHRVQALNIARDLAERMRTNRQAFPIYLGLNQYDTLKHVTSCIGDLQANLCTAEDFAKFDIQQVKQKASDLAMQVNILPCFGHQHRSCIYVAWGGTSATDSISKNACTRHLVYLPTSTCIVMEAY